MTTDVDHNSQPVEPHEPTPRDANFQLSLRGMLLLVFIVSVVIAVWIEFGPLAGSGVTFVALLVGAHLFGAWLGRSLHATRSNRMDLPRNVSVDSTDGQSPFTESQPHASSRHESVGVWTFAVIGALTTATLAGGGLLWFYSDQLSWISGIVAIGATASLGGLAGFGVGNLIAVCFRASLFSHEPIER